MRPAPCLEMGNSTGGGVGGGGFFFFLVLFSHLSQKFGTGAWGADQNQLERSLLPSQHNQPALGSHFHFLSPLFLPPSLPPPRIRSREAKAGEAGVIKRHWSVCQGFSVLNPSFCPVSPFIFALRISPITPQWGSVTLPRIRPEIGLPFSPFFPSPAPTLPFHYTSTT